MNKKLKKQFMSLLMTLIICTGMVPLKASAANSPAIEYMQVESSDGEVVNFDVIKKENPCNQKTILFHFFSKKYNFLKIKDFVA